MSKEERRLLFEQKYKDSQLQTPPPPQSIEIQKEMTPFQNQANTNQDSIQLDHPNGQSFPYSHEFSSSQIYFDPYKLAAQQL